MLRPFGLLLMSERTLGVEGREPSSCAGIFSTAKKAADAHVPADRDGQSHVGKPVCSRLRPHWAVSTAGCHLLFSSFFYQSALHKNSFSHPLVSLPSSPTFLEFYSLSQASPNSYLYYSHLSSKETQALKIRSSYSPG